MTQDKVTIKGIDALSRQGKELEYSLSFPFDERYFWAPASIREISIYEYHEGKEIYGFIPFKVYIGNITSIKEICESENKNYIIDTLVFNDIESVDDKLCYYEDMNGKNRVFVKVNANDIVVKNNDEFKEVMVNISKNGIKSNDEIKNKKRLHRIIRMK